MRNEIDPADLPAIYQRWRAAERITGKMGSALHVLAIAVNGFAVSEEKVFGPVAFRKERLIGDKARPVLIAKFGTEIADRACVYSVTKEALRTAASTVADKRNREKGKGEKRTTITSVTDDALEAIRKAGGVDVSFGTSVKEHKPKAAPAREREPGEDDE